MLSVIYAECHMDASFAECRYAECCYAQCRGTSLLSIIIYNRHIFKVQATDCLTSIGQNMLLGIYKTVLRTSFKKSLDL